MTITVNISDANLTELIARVEAGEEVILSRDDRPVARLSSVGIEAADVEARLNALEEVRKFRETMPRITQAEIAEWKALGRR